MSDYNITHNKELQRFEIIVDDTLSVLEYRPFDNGMIMAHTEVDPATKGKGIGSILAKHALDYARENHLKVVAVCPFVKVYMQRHPEYNDLL